MAIVLDGSTGITNDGGYTGDGVVFADTTPANTLVTTTGGNVGIGTSSPGQKLTVTGNISLPGTANRFISFGTSSNWGYTLSSNGNNFELYDVDNFKFIDAAYNSGGSTKYTNISSSFLVFNGGGEKMRLTTGGELCIGKTQASEGAQTGSGYSFAAPSSDPFFSVVNANASGGNACIYLNKRTTGSLIVFGTNSGSGFTSVGSITHNGSNTAYNTTSDYRLKDSVAPMTGALAKVAQLKPCTYTWKSTGANGQGFIAHELQEVFPDAVDGEKDALDKNGDIAPQGIDTSFLVATLTAAIQEQQAIITDQDVKMGQLVDQLTNAESTMNLLTEMFTESQQTVAALTARVEALEGTQP